MDPLQSPTRTCSWIILFMLWLLIHALASFSCSFIHAFATNSCFGFMFMFMLHVHELLKRSPANSMLWLHCSAINHLLAIAIIQVVLQVLLQSMNKKRGGAVLQKIRIFWEKRAMLLSSYYDSLSSWKKYEIR